MMENDLAVLVQINDMIIAEDIQRVLEDSRIYSLLVSDNPASSVLNVYTGINPIENISIQVNKKDYVKAIEIIKESIYRDLLANK